MLTQAAVRHSRVSAVLQSSNRSLRVTVLALLSALSLTTCSSQDLSSPTPPGSFTPPPRTPVPEPASIEMTGPASVVVNAMVPVTVVIKDKDGRALTHVSASLSSTNSGILDVSDGVIHGRSRGTARIDATLGSLQASIEVRVVARLKVELDLVDSWFNPMEVAPGDSVLLKAYLMDVNSRYLEERATVTWTSSDSSAVSVSANGLMVPIRYGSTAVITAVHEDATAAKTIWVSIPADAEPATVRVAHGAPGLGPLTFVPTKGQSATVSAGQSSTMKIKPGLFLVEARGFPTGGGSRSVEGVTVRPGEKVTAYVVGDGSSARFKWLWTDRNPIASDSVRLTVVQGLSGYPVLYIRPQGSEPDGRPDHCYLDPTDIAGGTYGAGALDLLLLNKFGSTVAARLAVTGLTGGKGYTLLLAGSPLTSMSHFQFADP